MSEVPPDMPVHVPVTPPAGMREDLIEFWDDATLTYYERASDGLVYSRPYTENELASYGKQRQLDMLGAAAKEAVPYLDDRLVKCLGYLELPSPTPEETAEVIRTLCDLAAYSAGTLKRVIVVLGELTGRPV
ncbi:hypothetical protein AVT29_gp46 [Streptomyces phage Amela]|uniref:Uncharacterized protein n=1 Tax=Streptomyces phage Amela TaxID=1673877 RepID=A0A0K1Y9M2_9CAUD|nr:hypothetical protein AVT29_gp46 [Streptomyces phage Amela]AKY03801.1 hypothetical protein SEA_AMELA_46 [Streptomyces phage Amela]